MNRWAFCEKRGGAATRDRLPSHRFNLVVSEKNANWDACIHLHAEIDRAGEASRCKTSHRVRGISGSTGRVPDETNDFAGRGHHR